MPRKRKKGFWLSLIGFIIAIILCIYPPLLKVGIEYAMVYYGVKILRWLFDLSIVNNQNLRETLRKQIKVIDDEELVFAF